MATTNRAETAPTIRGKAAITETTECDLEQHDVRHVIDASTIHECAWDFRTFGSYLI